ncbi:hypothetical protein A3I48_03530 [Candidatus Daviesbacteria bacterium RIFCSPLOWO2_02_FULL_36_7]|uniref:Uncharacterized protein n=1 Tax=Candidatus Daviesbacteria bacterium RIFCSPLOWO2_02_FULL_36_7 TaxID=1797792 RepID=A0A1F5MGT2_9BACT|nr:MAG: hypothetical protein A3I48_03530 [Candidatus Daviesbacteria bacterium RIFCSPLOWO2_02_FULL_36_7]
MLNENFVILGFVIATLGGLKYLVETIQGRVKPNRVTFFIWALAPLIAFTAEIKQGVGIQSLMTFGVGFGSLLIFIASFVNKKAQWKLGLFDFTCGVLSLMGILFWYITRSGNIAITFSIIADGLAALPTIVKSFRYPETENSWAYLTAAISASLTLLTIDSWDFAHYGFPVYILIVCLIIFSLVKFKLGKAIK